MLTPIYFVIINNEDFKVSKERSIMYVKEVVVQNQVGLYAKPATYFIQKANEFKSSIWVEKDDRRVNAKSLLGILSLGIIGGTSIRIIADGTDEEEAVNQLVRLVESGFSGDSSDSVNLGNSGDSQEEYL